MKTLLISILAIGLAMSTYAQEAKSFKRRATDGGQAITVTVVVQCPCQHQTMGPRQHSFNGPRQGWHRGQSGMGPRPMVGPSPNKEQRDWNKTLGARRNEMLHRLNPSGPYPRGSKTDPPVDRPKGE